MTTAWYADIGDYAQVVVRIGKWKVDVVVLRGILWSVSNAPKMNSEKKTLVFQPTVLKFHLLFRSSVEVVVIRTVDDIAPVAAVHIEAVLILPAAQLPALALVNVLADATLRQGLVAGWTGALKGARLVDALVVAHLRIAG